MQLGSMFISNCNNTLHVSDAFCVHRQEHLKTVVAVLYTIWLSAEAIDLGRPYWILHPFSCHITEAATTVFKCSWVWKQKASETCRVIFAVTNKQYCQVASRWFFIYIYIYIYIYIIPIKLEFSASFWFIHKESATMHGNTIVKNWSVLYLKPPAFTLPLSVHMVASYNIIDTTLLVYSHFYSCSNHTRWITMLNVLLLSVWLPVANAPDVLQPCGLLYYAWCSNSHHQSSPQEIQAVRGGAKPYYF